mgnify:CR=1 FL=1
MVMNTEMLRTIINAILTIIGILLTAYVIPWLKEKIGAGKMETLESYIIYAVRSAEQIYAQGENSAKKKYVYNYVLNKSRALGLDLTPEDIDLLVEGAVNLIKKGA